MMLFIAPTISSLDTEIYKSNDITTNEEFTNSPCCTDDYCLLVNWTIQWERPTAENMFRFCPWSEFEYEEPIICEFPEVNGTVDLKFKVNCISLSNQGFIIPRISIFHHRISDLDKDNATIWLDGVNKEFLKVTIPPGYNATHLIEIPSYDPEGRKELNLQLKCVTYGFPFCLLRAAQRDYIDFKVILI